jgi:hypothetical protein
MIMIGHLNSAVRTPGHPHFVRSQNAESGPYRLRAAARIREYGVFRDSGGALLTLAFLSIPFILHSLSRVP